MGRSKVVIIGGGFGGLTCAKELAEADVDVLLIDKTNHHLFQPLLYQVATAALAPRDIAVPIREVFKYQENVTVLLDEVTRIETDKKELTLVSGRVENYDYLVVAIGASHSYFGNNEWAEFAPGLKTLGDALFLREKILLAFERAEGSIDPVQTQKYLNFVVVGGGPTGVEMAGAIAEIAHKTMLKNFRRIDPDKTQVYLVEAGPHILPSYPMALSLRAKKDLEELGVIVLVDSKVTKISENRVILSNRTIDSSTVIWAAGNQAPALLATLGVPLDRQRRVIVDKDMSIPKCDEVFVIGDCACFMDENNKALPGVAPAAIQEGQFVANIIAHRIPKASRDTFCYRDKGSMATIGKIRAVACRGKMEFTGIIAWFMWCFIHVLYLVGYRNRLAVMWEWCYQYLTSSRSSRLIYHMNRYL